MTPTARLYTVAIVAGFVVGFLLPLAPFLCYRVK